jgi:para-aminobenzoate synthetase component 1
LVNSLGNYSIIGRKPYLKIEKKYNDTFVNGVKIEIDFETYVKSYFLENYQKNDTNLPLIAGAIGYFSYDYKRNKDRNMPESILLFYDQFIIEEHFSKSIYVIANGKTQKAEDAIHECESILHRQVRKQCKSKSLKIRYDFEKEDYLNAIKKMINYIIEGDIYIANMTQRLFLESDIEPYDLYSILRVNNPSPFAAYFNYEAFQVVCASPERFIKVKDKHIVTRPIKGTRKRGSTQAEDLIMKKELENSQKDKSELLMIVDLERNDLNKICEPGLVTVDHK